MSIDLQNQQVIVLGLGLTGQSCVRFAKAQGANVIGMDTRTELNIEIDTPALLGEFDSEQLAKADLILVSPGVDLRQPAIQAAKDAGVEVIGDVELFARVNTKPLIGITGSNGKSTVTALLTEMLLADGRKAEMGGNIGTPVLDLLETDADITVLELSSFQLETVASLELEAACILNISSDHLDRHGSLENYQNAKQRIYTNAKQRVCNQDDIATYPTDKRIDTMFSLSTNPKGFGWSELNQHILNKGEKYIAFSQSPLLGEHNVLNIQAAAALATLCGVSEQAIKQAVTDFRGLAHRCQTVGFIHDKTWVNDSKATNVGATIAAIDGLARDYSGKIVLLAGGDGKHADFSPLKAAFAEHLKSIITFGRDAALLANLFSKSHKVGSLAEAVVLADNISSAGDIVLLSPACASLDMFDNYQQRGDCFVKAVEALAE